MDQQLDAAGLEVLPGVEPEAGPAAPITSGDPAMARFAIIDDVPKIRAVLARVVAGLGYHCVEASTMEDVEAMMRHDPPHVVLLDLMLGEINGIEVMRLLARLGFAGSVALVSGTDSITLAQVCKMARGIGIRIAGTLSKPVRARELRDLVTGCASAFGAMRAGGGGAAGIRAEGPAGRGPAGPAGGNPDQFCLEEALSRGRMEVWYQPKVELSGFRVAGLEALIRHRHPLHGIEPPARFLGAITGTAMRDLTMFVVDRALADATDLARHCDVRDVAVNVPPEVLLEADFMRHVRGLNLLQRRVRLCAEITEADYARDRQALQEAALELRLHGLRFSLDDFGTEYSTLSRAGEFGFSEIKIDRSFVTGCGADQTKGALCRAVVDLSHALGATCTAEGVETLEELALLRRIGCDLAQGYLFARPVPVQQLDAAIAVVEAAMSAARPAERRPGAPSAR